MGDQERLPSGFLKEIANLQLPPQVAFAGHVRLVEGIVLPTYVGCHAVVVLNDPPGKEISVVTSEQRLQSLLETALATGYLMTDAMRGARICGGCFKGLPATLKPPPLRRRRSC
jgi:hypothetical protein